MVTEQFASKTNEELVNENLELQSRLEEAEETLFAIQNGEIDAIITLQGLDGPKVYTLESADTLYRNLVQEMNEGVATLTIDGTIIYGNFQLASMLQLPLEKLIGQRLNDFIVSNDIETYQTIFDKGFKTKSSGELSLKSVTGNVLPVYISVNTLKDLKGVYVVITDLSEQKHREELDKSLIELERSNAELQQFAYVASHDLREPLRMITSFLQLLERRYKDQLDDDANEFIGYAVDGAKRLDDMIKDILEYSKVTNKEFELNSVNVERVLEETLSTLKVQIDENNAIITHDPLPIINADKQLMIQLFQNIIGNAIKYHSQETPQIHISVTQEINKYKFAVEDNGIGMSPEHLEQYLQYSKDCTHKRIMKELE